MNGRHPFRFIKADDRPTLQPHPYPFKADRPTLQPYPYPLHQG